MLVLTLAKPETQLLISAYIFMGKLGIACGRNAVYIASNKFFPVSICATSIGICNVFARASTILAPYVAELKPAELPQWCFIGFCCAAIIAAFFLTTPKTDITQSFRSTKENTMMAQSMLAHSMVYSQHLYNEIPNSY